MSTTWRFSDLEFLVLWELFTGERLPAPFLFISTTPMYYDFLREKREVADKVHARWDRSLDELAQVFQQPDLRICVDGFDFRDDDEIDSRIRVMALRKAGRGFIVKQRSGGQSTRGSECTVTECDPIRLAEEVVAGLPEFEAGQQPDIPLVDTADGEGFDYDHHQSTVSTALEHRTGFRSKKFLSAPTVCLGTIDIVQGHSIFGPQGVTAHRLEWRDLIDDGRYVIGGDGSQVATAADAKRFTALINARVAAVIRAIKDERQI
ncbi:MULTISPECIES: ESX secretion-associated protein EspG [unclassified Nocardia]|uniref:ESX secretion-associated protein EspG n=1 Tax=unclassified Nocardia TaxID=2637762 RepID=UPI00278C0B16|nr:MULTISPECIES: ESX secretion-associated protein EspG [unclassified Nocardia]